jgi:ActD protein
VTRTPEGVLAIFEYLDDAVRAVRDLKAQRVDPITVTTPVPHHEMEEALQEPRSPVRFWVLTGGILGFVGSWVLTIWTSIHWGLVVGGKDLASIPPFFVIAFEMTVLFGSLFNLISMAGLAGLPDRVPQEPYDPRFTEDRIGIWVPCARDRVGQIQQILKNAGAEEVRVETR